MESTDQLPSVFVDGDLLVIDLWRASFPNRCCKSYEPTGEDRTTLMLQLTVRDGDLFASREERRSADEDVGGYPFEISRLPSEGAVLAAGLPGVLADTVGWASHRSTLSFTVAMPLSSTWQRRMSFGWGHAFLLLGVALGVVVAMAWMTDHAAWQTVAKVAAFLAVVAGGAGAILSYWHHPDILQARRYENGFLWIAGTDSAFRSHFPPWPGSVAKAVEPTGTRQ